MLEGNRYKHFTLQNTPYAYVLIVIFSKFSPPSKTEMIRHTIFGQWKGSGFDFLLEGNRYKKFSLENTAICDCFDDRKIKNQYFHQQIQIRNPSHCPKMVALSWQFSLGGNDFLCLQHQNHRHMAVFRRLDCLLRFPPNTLSMQAGLHCQIVRICWTF